MNAIPSVYAPLTLGSSLFALETLEQDGRQGVIFRNGPRTLPDIFGKLRRHGVAPILVTDHSVLSGQELLSRAGGQCAVLAERGITKGTRVALALADDIDLITSFVAIISLGASAVLVPEHTPGSLAYTLSAAQCERAISNIPHSGRLIDPNDFRSCPRAELPDIRVLPEDEALIAFTSGSTGSPKGVTVSHRAITTGLMNMMLAGAAAARGGRPSKPSRPIPPTVLLRAPFEHVSGYMQLLAMMWVGGSVLRSNEENIVELIAQHNVTSITGISEFEVAQLLAASNIYNLRSISMVGRAIPAALRSALRLNSPNLGVGAGYGLTETCGLVAGAGNAMVDARPRAVGTVVPTMECCLFVEGRDALPGEPGEVWLRGTALMEGYCGTDRGLTEDGWFQTGDIGFLSEDGCLHILDKEDRLIRAGGETLACRDLEDMAREIAGTQEIAALPHQAGVLVVCADAINSNALRDELVSRLPASIGSQLRIQSAKNLPRTASGKIAYSQIAASFNELS